MRFLIPVIVLIVTMVFMPGPSADPARAVLTENAYSAGQAEAAAPAEGAADYDDVVEESGLLNRLELLDF